MAKKFLREAAPAAVVFAGAYGLYLLICAVALHFMGVL